MKSLTQAVKRMVQWLMLVIACCLPASAMTQMASSFSMPTPGTLASQPSTGPWLSQGTPNTGANSSWDDPAVQYQAMNDLMGSTLTPDQAAFVAAPINNALSMAVVPVVAGKVLPALNTATKAADAGATFGRAASTDYRATFFAANPEPEGQVVVHHAVEQQTLKLYPSQVTEAEIHSLENLRGIPKDINSQVHLSQIRKEWNQFYLANPNATQAQLLQKAAEIDAKFGSQFRPPVGGGQ